jgi:predicted Fe-S protein YdhL (DUF1289 family)
MISRFAVICSAAAVLGVANASSGGAAIRREMTAEEHVLYAQQVHGTNWRSLSLAQRCARMQQVHARWRSMTPTAKDQLRQQLDARWNTMPAAEKQRIEQRIAFRRTQRADGAGRMGEPRCAGVASQSH